MQQLPTLQLAKLEQLALEQALRQTNTLEDAGKLLGISRHGVQRRLRKFQVERDRPAADPSN
mgnify:CR=1 FL=1